MGVVTHRRSSAGGDEMACTTKLLTKRGCMSKLLTKRGSMSKLLTKRASMSKLLTKQAPEQNGLTRLACLLVVACCCLLAKRGLAGVQKSKFFNNFAATPRATLGPIPTPTMLGSVVPMVP